MARRHLATAVALADVALQVATAVALPEVAIARSVIELATGKNMVTGAPLTPLGAAMEVLNIATLGFAGSFRATAAVLRRLSLRTSAAGAWARDGLRTIRTADRSVAAAAEASAVGHGADLALEGAVRRTLAEHPTIGFTVSEAKPLLATTLDESFRITFADGVSVIVKPHAMKHMYQHLVGRGRLGGHAQFPISPIARAIQLAEPHKLPMGRTKDIVVGDWELGFDRFPDRIELIHALYRPK